MKQLLLSALLLVGMGTTVQAQTTKPAQLKKPHKTRYDPQVYDVTYNSNEMTVYYRDSLELAAKFVKDAQLNRWNPEQQAEERAKLPHGGWLEGRWARRTPGLASADGFVFLVETPDGKEILRQKFDPTVPRPFTLMSVTLYTELVLVPLSKPLPDGARVFVIEAAAQERFEFIIHPTPIKD